MNQRKTLNQKRTRRIARTRARIFGTADRPRLAVSRSNRSIYAQLIDDVHACTLAAVSGRETLKASGKRSKTEVSKRIGELLAKKALEKGIKTAVLDRREYKYHGRVRAFAEGAREGGLKI